MGKSKENLLKTFITSYDPETNKKVFDEGWFANGTFSQGFFATGWMS